MSKFLKESLIQRTSDINKCEEVAYQLRNAVKSIKKRKIPTNVGVGDIIEGEGEIPEILFNFVCNLVQGPDIRRKNSTDDYIKIKSLCQDIIYIITKGRIKPAKHLMLGLAIKSLTSSKKVLTILNKYGHTVGYTVAEELETEMTYTAYNTDQLVPASIRPLRELRTHLAFDNYDRFVETFSGKDTLHDTVGIIYQFCPETCSEESLEILNSNMSIGFVGSNTSSSATSFSNVATTSFTDITERYPRKRRRFEEISREIQPYHKKPSAKTNLIPLDAINNIIEEFKISTKSAITKDLIWVFSLSLIQSTPMWTGFNGTMTLDNSERQIVDYLPQINLSPTSYSVVHETMLYAQRIAKECDQQQIIISYDLAIAKMAMQIKMTEAPKFDNIFVNLGAFHIQMAFFKAIGKYIDSCGITDILVQAEVLAEGSTNGFLSGKHFNRCKRIHPLLSGALQILNFEQFISENNIDEGMLIEDLNYISSNPIEYNELQNTPETLRETLTKYETFVQETLNGFRGKTAQYYMQYTEFVNMYFKFTRSIRTSDFELYLDSLFDIANLFFIFNQSNYARWILKYLCNLIDLKLHKSELYEDFIRGAFGVKRTNIKFSRSPVDLTLEQTINADAASSLTGVTHFSNSISARQRWALSHSIRTKIISRVLDELQITSKDDSAHELESHRIEKDRRALKNIAMKIKENINPFDRNIDSEYLYNISTGRAASDDTSSFLLNAKILGETKKNTFIAECNQDSSRFERPIQRHTIHNFAAECVKQPLTSRDGKKRVLLKMERDIFGRLLAIALEKKIDIELCLSYPLSPAPTALCHNTGEMFKTDKSKLAHKLKSFIEPSTPLNVDIETIDGFYFLHRLGPSAPNRFDKLAEFILRKICFSKAPEIHIIFDRYIVPSIKDVERLNRHEIDRPYEIVGPSQIRPNDLIKSMKNKKFKDALVQFLSEQWENENLESVLGNKKVLITVQEKCFSFVAENNVIKKREEIDFECFHEEADSRIIYHISKSKADAKIQINAVDADILIILLGNIHKFTSSEIWLGSTTKSFDVNYINCTKLAQILGSDICLSLPAFHAFTGSDYTASFYRKGKVKGFKLLQKCKNIQNVLTSLNDPSDVDNEEKMKTIQEFTCQLYGISHCCNVNFARLIIFQKQFSTKSTEQLNTDVKVFDSSLIPPCWSSLKQKILRTIYIASMWKHATDKNCVKLDVEQCGWIRNDKAIEPRWFEGDLTPLTVNDILLVDNDDDDNFENAHISFDDEE